MNKKQLHIAAAIIWGIPGVIISVKGIKAYTLQPLENIWWLLLITAAVMTGFFFMFRRIVSRYSDRIASLSGNLMPWDTFPLRGWILLGFMMGLGIALRSIPGIPSAFIASFYSGLGPMLLMGSARFICMRKRIGNKD